MFCQTCGKGIPDDCVFCPECGAKQEPEPVIKKEEVENQATKYCVDCGSKIPADSRFCPECRIKQEDIPAPAKPKKTDHMVTPEVVANTKKRNKMIAIAVGGVLALCLMIGLAFAFIKPTINLNKYLTVSFEGYDTIGKANIIFDEKKFEKDYGRNIQAKMNRIARRNVATTAAGELTLFDTYDTSSASGVFLSTCVGGSIDKMNGLNNDDIVTFTWKCNDQYALDGYGYKLKYKDIESVVSNLKQAETFDPFEGIEVTFEGISSDGTASIAGTPKAKEAEKLSYDFDEKNDLKNGDTITVTVSADYTEDVIEYCINNYGKIPSPLEKTFTVEGLNSYIRAIKDVSEDSLAQMQSQAKDIINADVAKNWDTSEKLKSFTYIGSYLLTQKNSNNYLGSTDNTLYLVYKAQVKTNYSYGEQTYNKTNDIYWYTAYSDLLVDPKGVTTVDIIKYSTPNDRMTIDSGIGNGWGSTISWNHYGYQTLEELYRAVVTSNIEYYNHEDNVDEGLADTPNENGVENTAAEDGIIFPDSSERKLDEGSISLLTEDDLQSAINELYARNSYIFKDDAIRAYYQKYEWYQQKVKPEDFTMDLFNKIEKANVELLQKERANRN